jgi:HSP20 family protein
MSNNDLPVESGKAYTGRIVPSFNAWPSLRDEFLTPFDRVFDKLTNDLFPSLSKEFGVGLFAKESYPKVDIVDRKDRISIEAEIPGLKKDQITVDVKDGVLTISGQKQTKKEDVEEDYIRVVCEIKRSSFRRSFILGDNLDHDSVKAQFQDGVLVIDIAKVKPVETKAKVIDIK